MTSAIRILAAAFLSAFLLSSCQTAQKFTESGDYDGAIDFCVRKLRGKSKKKLEYVQGLELAFKKAQTRDLAVVEQMLKEDRPELWENIHNIHLNMRNRQNKVMPLTPLVAKNGYRAQFQFVDIAAMERKSREEAADYLYNRALSLIDQAEAKDDKLAARKAYSMLCDLGYKYYNNYRDSEKMMTKARRLGTSYVLFEVKNRANVMLPRGFAERLMAIGKQDLDDEWREYFFDTKSGMKFDYKAVLLVNDIDISPERVQERSYIDEKSIQDGWNYVLDKRGNVMKDSLGNDIKTPRMVNIRAEILEVHQSKAARITATIEVRDTRINTLMESRNLATEVLFENYASTFRGDERALSNDSKRRIGNRPLPFPPNEDMLVQAADRLKPDVREELRRSRSIL